ncbi:hypothetical protein AQPE_5074 [Aquipluma nitroreducens]|jgi:hypothetical protein|uniref:Uncharacterized protein n=1 Tax=Aquipluma nitroreducens TaxID=2010828 RepID=A0A5K7SH97_9BACT|nr:hypothetical protein AQPE_5074 [Aquipluma nitroreducens]
MSFCLLFWFTNLIELPAFVCVKPNTLHAKGGLLWKPETLKIINSLLV